MLSAQNTKKKCRLRDETLDLFLMNKLFMRPLMPFI